MWHVPHRIGQLRSGSRPLIIVTPEQLRGVDGMIPACVWHSLRCRRVKSTRAIADLSERVSLRKYSHAALVDAESVIRAERPPLAPWHPRFHQHSTPQDVRAIGTQLQGSVEKRTASFTLVLPAAEYCSASQRRNSLHQWKALPLSSHRQELAITYVAILKLLLCYLAIWKCQSAIHVEGYYGQATALVTATTGRIGYVQYFGVLNAPTIS